MLKGLGDIGNLMKLQGEMKKLQSSLKKMKTTASSNDTMVTVTINGEFEALTVSVEEEKMRAASKIKIEMSIAEAYNNAVRENKRIAAEKMKDLTGGMKIPGLDGLI